MKLPDKIRLYIGKYDINKGCRHDGYNCPIALALQRKFPKSSIFIGGVSNNCPLLDLSSIDQVCYTKCKIADKFIRDFDNKRAVKPVKIILTKVK